MNMQITVLYKNNQTFSSYFSTPLILDYQLHYMCVDMFKNFTKYNPRLKVDNIISLQNVKILNFTKA